MNTTAFQELTEEKERLRKRADALEDLRTAERVLYYQNSERFTILAIAIAGGELLLSALLFDYMVTLNFILTRAILWILIAVITIGIARFMHIWVFLSTHRARVAQKIYKRINQRITAIDRYEGGIIDASGIRLLYQEDERERLPRMLRVSETIDWVLFGGIMLASFLFGMIFI